MLSVPYPPRRSHLLGFWITLIVGVYILLVLLGATTAKVGLVLYGGVGLGGLFVAGLFWGPLPLFSYRVWNVLAVRFARLARTYVAALLHFLVMTARGPSPTLALKDPSGSMWSAYGERGTSSSLVEFDSHGSWIRRFVQEASQPGRKWWLLLLPMLMILSFFVAGSSKTEDVPENVYTLF